MDFTFSAYEGLVKLIQDKGYQICNYFNYIDYKKCVIMRHDVDLSLEDALAFAYIENKLGIKTTYFILLSTDYYNISSKESRDIIKKIINLGHEVGLHFDEMKYKDETNDITESISDEIIIMSYLLNYNIRCVSMHIPSIDTLNNDYNIPGIVNSYSKLFFKEFKYLSDSSHRWREPVLEIIKDGNYQRLHILTHPFWYKKNEAGAVEDINNFVKRTSYKWLTNLYREILHINIDTNTN